MSKTSQIQKKNSLINSPEVWDNRLLFEETITLVSHKKNVIIKNRGHLSSIQQMLPVYVNMEKREVLFVREERAYFL